MKCIVIILLLIPVLSFSQTKKNRNCEAIKEGVFYDYNKGDTVFVVRIGDKQEEFIPSLAMYTVSEVTWKGCSYSLKIVQGGKRMGLESDEILDVKISTITDDYYSFRYKGRVSKIKGKSRLFFVRNPLNNTDNIPDSIPLNK